MIKSSGIFFIIILIQTIKGQNQAPRFEPSLQYNYFFSEYNVTKPGNILMWLNATDNDDDDLQFGVEGDFYNKLIKVKKIDGKHAQVIVQQIFDREVQEKYENIFFYVKDKPGNKVYQSVRFVILDIDDNAPIFKNTPYKVDVNENTPLNTIIFDSIEAIDMDGPQYNKFTFSLEPNFNHDKNMFQIDKTNHISSGHYKSKLTLVNELDYEKSKSHVINIKAIGENSAFSTSTQLVINVIDYPDRPPEFTQSPYYVKIEEELPLGQFVLRVSARDGDTGINNLCKYNIIYENNPASEYFDLDSITGDLTILKRIDLESEDIIKLGGLLEFKIVATEIGDEKSTAETLVTVAIFDLNDNKPKFNDFFYDLKISPKSLPGTSLALVNDQQESIHVFDLDKGINGSFSLYLLRIVESNRSFTTYDDYTDFEVVPKIALNDANLIIKLKDSANLIEKMGRTEHYHIFAKDNGIKGNITYANLMIKIDSINRFAPKFPKEFYVYYLNENSPYNTTIDYISAYDNDTLDDYGRIYYELKNGQEKFQIDQDTGRIYTISYNPNQQLDRELIDTFYLSVDAIDSAGLRTSVQIIIKLNDLNDNAPQFLNNLFSLNIQKNNSNINNKMIANNILVGYIEENSAKWLESIKLQAVDRDIGINSMISYEIIGGDYLTDYFKIDNKTNTIVLKNDNKLLDYEEIYEMHSMKNYLNVKSSILNDYAFDTVELNSDEIDINLVILAKDWGEPSLNSTIVAKIIIKDINDHQPKFNQKFYSTQVLETAKSGVVFQVKAIDLDAPNTLNSRISYRIESGSRDKFYIDSNTGIVKISKDALLDRDVYGSVYNLKIIANDFGTLNENMSLHSSYKNNRSYNLMSETDLQLNVCYLKIEIIDVNNKKPQFLIDNDFVAKISENALIGTIVVSIRATDPDSNPDLVYYLVKSSNLDNNNLTLTNEIFQAFDENKNPINVDLIKDWFDIDKNGNVFTKSKLDRELVEQVNLVIGVEDLNASAEFRPQIQTTVLKIKIQDVNDNYPIFPNYKLINHNYLTLNDEPTYEAFESIEENIKLNTKLLQLKAIDLDKKRNITYKLIHSTAKKNLLLLDLITGEIFVNGIIDYEQLQWINLTIIAFDNGIPNQKHSLLLLNFKIEDLNDNEPIFEPLNMSEFNIYENSPENTVVAKFTATDADSGQFGTLFYRLISGDEGKFYLDSQTGVLYVKSLLDREEQDLFTLVIQARDNPNAPISQQLSDSLLIKIRILDLNDNSPYCEYQIYTVETIQNADINTTLLQIKGLDKDIGKNAIISYSLKLNNESKEKDLFKINSSNGLIQVNKKLLGYSGLYSSTVLLKDNDGDELLSSNKGNCTVFIQIKDFNSHPPKFNYPDQKNPSIRIKSSLLFGSYIMTVNATDPDNDPDGEIIYYLDEERKKNNDWKSFNIDSKSGVLTLNTKLNLNKQAVYTIDIIASDQGRPMPLNTRITVTFIVVDNSNNSVQFNRMQICVSGQYQCDSNFQTVILRLTEEKINKLETKTFRLAKINDITKIDDDICYYLGGQDKDYFELNKMTGILKQKLILNKEIREKYEIIIKSTEHCYCLLDEKFSNNSNECSFLNNNNYDVNDLSQLLITIYLDDINDNSPIFSKKFYQIGITSDVEFDETIFESFAFDLDSNSTLNFSIVQNSLLNTAALNEENKQYFPFKLEFFESKLIKKNQDDSFSKQAKFQLKTQKHFRDQDFNINQNRNNFYQFNITVQDENNRMDKATIQVILINKQQRVKLVFVQPIEKVISFQEDFRAYVKNLTGYIANIDKISLHRGENNEEDEDDEEENQTSTFVPRALTDMFLHFVKSDTSVLCDWNIDVTKSQIENNIINADTILNVLDKSKDIELLRKYKLSLAEKYDNQGGSTFYKYGSSAIDDEFGSFFLWSSSKNYSSFLARLILSILCVILLFFSCSTLVICCFMRNKYKKKIKTEKALIKAFGLEQRSLSYNDAISGYVNSAFDSNSLLPIPGTNLYSYEGSNPIWLRKYDKIDDKTQPSTSSSSPTSNETHCNSFLNSKKISTNISNTNKSKMTEECSSFYLKQLDSPPMCISRSSSTSENRHTVNKSIVENTTITNEILSIKNSSPNEQKEKKVYSVDTLLTFASGNNNNNLRSQSIQLNSTSKINNQNENTILNNMKDDNDHQKKYILLNQQNSKDCNDLFAVESTVI